MGYSMKGSPAKLGTIQGTSGHASALKQADELSQANQLKEYKAKQELDELKKKAAKKGEKKETKRKLKVAPKDEKGDFIPMSLAGTADEDVLTDKEINKALKKNKKKQEKRDVTAATVEKKEAMTAAAAEKKEAMTSNKTKNLRAKSKKVADKLKTADKDKKWWRNDKARKRRLGRKEDRLTDATEKSETYDALSPDEKTAKSRERMAYITAMFNDDASTMHQIAKGNTNNAKKKKDLTDTTKADIEVQPPFIEGAQIGGNPDTNVKEENTDKYAFLNKNKKKNRRL